MMGSMNLGDFKYSYQSLVPPYWPSSYPPYFIYFSLPCCITGSSPYALMSNCFYGACVGLTCAPLNNCKLGHHPHSNYHIKSWQTYSNGSSKFTPYWIQRYVSSMFSLLKQTYVLFTSLHAPFCGDISSWWPYTGYYFCCNSSTSKWGFYLRSAVMRLGLTVPANITCVTSHVAIAEIV